MRTVEELAEDIRALTPEERRTIAIIAMDMPEDEDDEAQDPTVAAAWEAEIDRRIRSIDDGTAVGIPWEEVKRKMDIKYGR